MKRCFFLVVFHFLILELSANHIVGGELEFITLRAGFYRINLVQYRDETQTENTVIEDQYEVYIFSNKNNELISTHLVSKVLYEEVHYTNQKCAIGQLKTSKVVWSGEFTLAPEDYGHEEGYYLVWERCCRNEAVMNIVSPLQTGMKYVLEIPPLWKDGAPFINSTPELLKPLSDYACVGQLFYTEFTGHDRDGDSLVYKMATPLNSSAFTALPIPQPKPHIPVRFTSGISESNMVPGNPSLAITRKGLLTVKPSAPGLYVFSVIVEEWRNQQMIGYVQRDFQILVLDGCTAPEPPQVGVLIPGDDDFQSDVDLLDYKFGDNLCFDFYVTNITEGETITLRAEGVNFEGDMDEIFAFNSAFINAGMDTLLVEVCVPECPPLRDRPFIIDFIAGDDACPLPQLDTVRLTIQVEPPPNTFPTLNTINSSYLVAEGDELVINISSTDADNDFIGPIFLIEEGLGPAEIGISFDTTLSEEGILEGVFRWNTNCQLYNFSDYQEFHVGFLMEDLDTCDVPNPNIFWTTLTLDLPPNTGPSISSNLGPELSMFLGDSIDNYKVFANDSDGDSIDVFLVFDQEESREDLGISFEDKTGKGFVESLFYWVTDCRQLEVAGDSTTYQFYFIAEDRDRCKISNRDTLVLDVEVLVPENGSPEFVPQADTVVEVGTLLEMDVTAFDPDPRDSITLQFYDRSQLPDSPSLSFGPTAGVGEVSSVLSWRPECDLLDFGESSAFYELTFLAFDNRCPVPKSTTATVTVEVRETRDAFDFFEPPNAFSPNGDGKNDTYSLSNQVQPYFNLPGDNCHDVFERVVIFDRSGVVVFETAKRDFVWDGANAPSGVYYYLVQYSNTRYKGYIQLFR